MATVFEGCNRKPCPFYYNKVLWKRWLSYWILSNHWSTRSFSKTSSSLQAYSISRRVLKSSALAIMSQTNTPSLFEIPFSLSLLFFFCQLTSVSSVSRGSNTFCLSPPFHHFNLYLFPVPCSPLFFIPPSLHPFPSTLPSVDLPTFVYRLPLYFLPLQARTYPRLSSPVLNVRSF